MSTNSSSVVVSKEEPTVGASSAGMDVSVASSAPSAIHTATASRPSTKTRIQIALPGRAKKSSLSSLNQEKKNGDDDHNDDEETSSTIAATPHLASRNINNSNKSSSTEWRNSIINSSSSMASLSSRRNQNQQQQEQHLYKSTSRSFVTPTPHRWGGSISSATCAAASNNNNNSSSLEWPKESSMALPDLSPYLRHGLRRQQQSSSSNAAICMPINEECTALKLTPSGRLIVAGFTDGTLRLYDLTVQFLTSSSSTSTLTMSTNKKNKKKKMPFLSSSSSSGKNDNIMGGGMKNDTSNNDDDDGDGFDSDSSFDPPLDDPCLPPPAPPVPVTQATTSTTTAAVATSTSSSSSFTTTVGKNGTAGFVDSNHFQRYGAVAAQIHAKGVHTSLAMDVDITEDGLWAFAGVLRGSMELLAVHLGHVESRMNLMQQEYQDEQQPQQQQQQHEHADTSAAAATPRVRVTSMKTTTTSTALSLSSSGNLLDYVSVYRHSDAKLRGFGACTCLENKSSNGTAPLQYLLFTGKAIKNIHVWSFQPPQNDQQQPIWTQLYDTQTNGNTIKLLQFRRHFSTGKLQALSKSDGQKLRVWDLQVLEEKQQEAATVSNDTTAVTTHPLRKLPRPPFQDVAHSESTLGVSGGFCLCGGSELYNQMKIVSLDVDDLQSSYNHTELALPSAPVSAPVALSSFSNSSNSNNGRRRQQRGELKSIISVAGSVLDSGFVLLELSDGTVLQYSQNPQTHLPMLKFPRHNVFFNNNNNNQGISAQDVHCKMTVARIGRGGVAVAAVATYHSNKGSGQISLVCLEDDDNFAAIDRVSRPGFWGFCGQSTVPHPMLLSSSSSSPPPPLPLSAAATSTLTTSTDCPTTTKKAAQKDAKMEDVGSDSFSAVVKCTPLLSHAALNTHVVSSDKSCLTSTSSSATLTTKLDIKTQTRLVNKKVKAIDTLPLVRCLAEHMAAPPNRGSLSGKMTVEQKCESSIRTSNDNDGCVDKVSKRQNGSKRRVQELERLSVAANDSSLNGGVSRKSMQVNNNNSTKSRNGQEIHKTCGPPKESSTSPVKQTNRMSGEGKAVVGAASMGSKNVGGDTLGARDLKSHLQKTTKRLEIAEPSVNSSPVPLGKRSRNKDNASEKTTGHEQSSCSPTKASTSNKRFRKEQSEKKACPDKGIVDMASKTCNTRPTKPTPTNKPMAGLNKSAKTQTHCLLPIVRDQESLLRQQIAKECQLKRERVEAILQSIPRQSTYARRGLLDMEEASTSTRTPLEAEHCAERALLSLKIWEATRSLIISIQECPSLHAIKQARQFMHNVLESYREMAVTMMNRQEMESLAMAHNWVRLGHQASQTARDNDGLSSSGSFQFTIFDQALDCMPQVCDILTSSAIADPSSTARTG